jgi:hypothetical protein
LTPRGVPAPSRPVPQSEERIVLLAQLIGGGGPGRTGQPLRCSDAAARIDQPLEVPQGLGETSRSRRGCVGSSRRPRGRGHASP